MRRDKLGRRIGRNRWREYITDAWRCAHHAWWLAMEAECIGYATEQSEWQIEHPCPRLGDFMTDLSDSWARPMAA